MKKPVPPPKPLWYQHTLVLGLAGAVLLWAAFPPFDLWPLAWVAPVPWLVLVRVPKLVGWKPYLLVWFAGFGHWLLMLEGVRLAHPALYGGWLALSAYLAVYLVLFVALSRVAVHQLRWPLWIAAPVMWIGIELLRSYLISGFASGLLAHTQITFPLVLQMADIAGGYFVSGLMILVASAVVMWLPEEWLAQVGWTSGPTEQTGRTGGPTYGPVVASVVALVALISALGYGFFRLNEALPADARPPLKVALIQGSLDTQFDQPFRERVETTFKEYDRLTRQAVQEQPQLDLIVWPESMFAMPELHPRPSAAAVSPESVNSLRFADDARQFGVWLADAQRGMNGAAFLLGANTLEVDVAAEPYPTFTKTYNSALLASAEGKVVSRYYKMHAVMFGEYIPVADLFPFLYDITPMPAGLTTGTEPVAMELKGYRLAPNICFESTVPQLIRAQVSELERTTKQPVDVIVNVSNDGWFWGSSILDLHFRGSVLRAVENRKPLVAAANTGISAHIDGNGRVLARGPKRAPQVLIANVKADGRVSLYHALGDVPAWLCAWITWGLGVYGVWRR